MIKLGLIGDDTDTPAESGDVDAPPELEDDDGGSKMEEVD